MIGDGERSKVKALLSDLLWFDEPHAFNDLPPVPDRVTERLCRLVLLGILSAVVERDLLAFGAALDELQARIGAAFAPVQGSVYISTQFEGLIADLGRPGRSPGMCRRGRT